MRDYRSWMRLTKLWSKRSKLRNNMTPKFDTEIKEIKSSIIKSDKRTQVKVILKKDE